MPQNYRIQAINELLCRDCVLERYYPLIPIKEKIIDFCAGINCNTKDECLHLSDQRLLQSGLFDQALLDLFKRFLTMYDIGAAKLREIDRLSLSDDEAVAFRQLYLLPGVRAARAALYFKAGIKRLRDVADSTPQGIIEKTTRAIKEHSLGCKAPLPKEAKTHIAVSRAFTVYSVS